jgi:hypothetical protein
LLPALRFSDRFNFAVPLAILQHSGPTSCPDSATVTNMKRF